MYHMLCFSYTCASFLKRNKKKRNTNSNKWLN